MKNIVIDSVGSVGLNISPSVKGKHIDYLSIMKRYQRIKKLKEIFGTINK
jgi:hypothetical protein